jgi:hypothetical protein
MKKGCESSQGLQDCSRHHYTLLESLHVPKTDLSIEGYEIGMGGDSLVVRA